ncbi:MAG: ABC transporter ATP-binding protein [Ilumatobacteraceae bacterium]
MIDSPFIQPVITVEGLRVRYDGIDVVDGISFEVLPGEIFGLLGPNGAGKTTTVEVLEGHRRRSEGTVQVLGFDPQHGGRAFREQIGIVLQEAGLDGDLLVHEALSLFADVYPNPRDVDEVVSMVELDAKRRARIRTLSIGQRRRLDLALALVGDPDLLLLDEPTTGFDPAARHQAWRLLDDLRQRGKTIVLTTHYMDEVQRLADRVLVLMAGRVVATGPPQALRGREHARTEIRFRLSERLAACELPIDVARSSTADDFDVLVYTDHPTQVLASLTAWALDHGDELQALTVSRPALEDVLLDLTSPVPMKSVER